MGRPAVTPEPEDDIPIALPEGSQGGSGPTDIKKVPRSRTRSRNGFFFEVTAMQADVIRARASRDNVTIKDLFLGSVMRVEELEATCETMRRTMTDIQAMILSASTERALTKEEATIWAKVTGMTSVSGP